MGALNDGHFFLIGLKAERSEIKKLADLVLGESPLPGLQMTVFSLYLTWKRKRALVSPPLLTRALIPSGDTTHDVI